MSKEKNKERWHTVTLPNLAENLDRRRVPLTKADRISGPYPYYGASGIVDYVEGYLFEEETLLISEDGANLLARSTPIAFLATGKYWVNNHAHILRFKSCITQRFVELYLESIPLDSYITGTAQPKLNQSALNSIPIQIPTSLQEQERIVNILDDAFEGVAAAKANTKKNLQATRALFEAFRDSVFLSSEVGTHIPLREFAAFRNGVNFTRSSRGRTLNIVGVKDFQDRFLIPTEGLDSVTIDGEVNDDDILRSDDLLTVRSNGNAELIGRTMVAENCSPNVLHSGFTIRTRLLKEDVSPKYLCHFMRSRRTRRQMIDGGNGVNIKSLNQGTLGDLMVPLPPHHKQIAIAAKIEQISIETQLLEQSYKQKLSALADLKSSLLHQAFSGNL